MSRRQTVQNTPSPLVLAIDADATNRRSIALVVRSAGGQPAVAATACDAVQLLGSREPAMIICSIPVKCTAAGLDAITMFHARVPGCPVVAFAIAPDHRMAVRCMRAGASDVFGLDDLKSALFLAIQESVHRGQRRPGASEFPRPADPVSALDELGRRILDLVRQGLNNKQIASGCGCSEKTVERRLALVRDALGVSSRHDMLRALVSMGAPAAPASQPPW